MTCWIRRGSIKTRSSRWKKGMLERSTSRDLFFVLEFDMPTNRRYSERLAMCNESTKVQKIRLKLGIFQLYVNNEQHSYIEFA